MSNAHTHRKGELNPPHLTELLEMAKCLSWILTLLRTISLNKHFAIIALSRTRIWQTTSLFQTFKGSPTLTAQSTQGIHCPSPSTDTTASLVTLRPLLFMLLFLWTQHLCPCCSCHPSHPFNPTTNYTSDSLWFCWQYPSSLLTFLLYQPWQKPYFLFQVSVSSSLRYQKVPRRQPCFLGVCLPSLPGSKRSCAKLRAPN